MGERRIIFCGGRDFADIETAKTLVDTLPEDTVVVHGGGRGADQLIGRLAHERGLPVVEFVAEWHRWGKAAGPKRNQWMVNRGADLVIALPGGKGTADCVARAEAAGIPVRQIDPTGPVKAPINTGIVETVGIEPT